MTTLRIALLGIPTLLFGNSVSAATMTPNVSLLSAVSDDDNENSAFSFYDGTSIPTVPAPLLLDAIDGQAYSKNTIDWSVVGGQTILSFDASLKRLGVEGSYASFRLTELGFRVDEAAPYELSGYLDMTDVGAAQSGTAMLSVRLFDYSTSNYLFSSWQWSANTHNEQFVAGGLGGDYFNELTPGSSQTGTLIPGHDYVLAIYAFIATADNFNPGGPDSGARAIGNFTLKVGMVPESSTVALSSIFAVLGLVRRRPGKSC